MRFDLFREKMVFIGFMFVSMDEIFLIHRFEWLLVMLMLIQVESLLQALVYTKETLVNSPSIIINQTPFLLSTISGIPCEFLIDTMNAGAGALAVTVDGPSKVQLDCREVAEGTTWIFLRRINSHPLFFYH